jgi:translation initiation factor 5B
MKLLMVDTESGSTSETESDTETKAPAKASPKASPKESAVKAKVNEEGGSSDNGGQQQAKAVPVKTAQQKKSDKKKGGKKAGDDEDLDALLAEINGTSPAPAKSAAPAAAGLHAVEKAKTKESAPAEPASPSKGKAEIEESEDDDDDENAAGDDADGSSKSKTKRKKKKKKAAVADDKPDEKKKVPSKMAQLLKKQMEERERELAEIARQEEERRLLEEEDRRLQEEEERERERRKAEKRERKEQLKKEGKLLSTKEKERIRLAQEKLEQMKAQLGTNVQALTSEAEANRPKKVVYGKKPRKNDRKPASGTPSSELSHQSPVTEQLTATSTSDSAAIASELAEAAAEEDQAEEDQASGDEGGEDDKEVEEEDDEDPVDDWETEDADTLADVLVQKLQLQARPDEAGVEVVAAKNNAVAAAATAFKAAKAGKTPEDAAGASVEAAASIVARDLQEGPQAQARVGDMRSPVVVVMGHVDTGKTKLLDKIRSSNVQDGEAGGITQQIGATFIPGEEIRNRTKSVKKAQSFELKIPGLLVIDTPGHESFSNLRSRGSSLCDIAVLVVDIMHGLEQTTLESLKMLRDRKTPFIVALNKVDRLNEWVSSPWGAIQNTLKKQKASSMQEFNTRVNLVKAQFQSHGLNTALYYENEDDRQYINIVPTSAISGEGVPDMLFLLTSLPQKRMVPRLTLTDKLSCTVLEVKAIDGHGMTIDVILVDGTLYEGDTIVSSGLDGPIVTVVRSLLMPAPLKEMRVKNSYNSYKEIRAAQGVKIAAKDLEKSVAGLPLYVCSNKSPEELEQLKALAESNFKNSLQAVETVDRGVYVQASTLGSLEALLAFLKTSNIPVSAINIGPVHKRDVTRCLVQLDKDPTYAVLMAFDVPIDRDAQLYADDNGIKLFTANIIYHLFDKFTAYLNELKQRKREQFKHIATFPCRLKMLPACIFNARDPIVVGVVVEEGILKVGTKLCVPSKDFVVVGIVASIENNHESQEIAKKGQEVCIKIEAAGSEKKLVGWHFEVTDELVSMISRESIDAVKEHFREDLTKDDWRLMKHLKERVFKFV